MSLEKVIYLNGIEVTINSDGNSIKVGKENRKLSTTYFGYIIVRIKSVTYRVHRLVATTFIPNPENKPFINHKNGIKSDNRVENLEWCTAKENLKHARDNKLNDINGEGNGNSKLSEKEVVEIKRLLQDNQLSQNKIAKMYKVNQSTISSIKVGRLWSYL